MGKEKTTTIQESRGTQEATQQATQTQMVAPVESPEDKRLKQLQLQGIEATQPGLIAAQTTGLDLVRQLLSGNANLPGFFQNLHAGISPEVTSDIVQQSLSDLAPQFQQSGLLDSGVRASVGGRIAGDIRRGAEEFNIGNRLNLLNLALSGQAQVQQPVLAGVGQLQAQLAGVRAVSTTGGFSGSSMGSSTGRSSTTLQGMNPFLKSFQTALGQNIGGFGSSQGFGGAAGGQAGMAAPFDG